MNTDKTLHMVMSHDQNAGQSHNIKTDNSPSERAEGFKYLETTLTEQNSIKEKLRADWGHEMLAIICCRIFCLPVCYPKI